MKSLLLLTGLSFSFLYTMDPRNTQEAETQLQEIKTEMNVAHKEFDERIKALEEKQQNLEEYLNNCEERYIRTLNNLRYEITKLSIQRANQARQDKAAVSSLSLKHLSSIEHL